AAHGEHRIALAGLDLEAVSAALALLDLAARGRAEHDVAAGREVGRAHGVGLLERRALGGGRGDDLRLGLLPGARAVRRALESGDEDRAAPLQDLRAERELVFVGRTETDDRVARRGLALGHLLVLVGEDGGVRL